jgi:hypothetical protein
MAIDRWRAANALRIAITVAVANLDTNYTANDYVTTGVRLSILGNLLDMIDKGADGRDVWTHTLSAKTEIPEEVLGWAAEDFARMCADHPRVLFSAKKWLSVGHLLGYASAK